MGRVWSIGKPWRKLLNFIVNAHTYGMAGVIELYGFRLRERYRDWRLGIRTSGYIQDETSGGDCFPYEPINYRTLDVVFQELWSVSPEDVFLDYGCGLGRAVVVAATHPFSKVIGVELSGELCAAAANNVARARRGLVCQDVEIINMDATEYEVPTEVNTVFLFNPFAGSVLESVQQRIFESIVKKPRRLRIVYLRPVTEASAFDECLWLSKHVERVIVDWHEVKLLVYENWQSVPAA